MASKKNTCGKKIRTPRVVANAKPLNRKGGGVPQPVRITSMDRVNGTQGKVYDLAWKFVNDQGKMTEKIERHLWFWSGISPETSEFKLTEKETALIREALTFAVSQTPDAPLAFTPYGTFAVPFAGLHPIPLGSVREDKLVSA